MQYTITFNTGRGYSSEGQVVTARQDTDEQGRTTAVLFHDHSRGIYGAIDNEYCADESLEDFVMGNYDAGLYIPGGEAGRLEIQEH